MDHAANARSVGLALQPTMLLIFGNPQAGTVLAQVGQALKRFVTVATNP